MAIKRYTTVYEIDDSSDRTGATSVPAGLHQKPQTEVKPRQTTGSSFAEEDPDTSSVDIGVSKPRSIGRTFPDLIAEFMNEPRAMATILMSGSIALFVLKIDKPSDLLTPILTGVVLNLLWFGVPWVSGWFSPKSEK